MKVTQGLHRTGVAPYWYATRMLTLYKSGKRPYATKEVALKPASPTCWSVFRGETMVPHQACQKETRRDVIVNSPL
jgi:hypothetical protein